MKNIILFCTLILLIGCTKKLPKQKRVIKCKNPRPQICTRIYAPVCDPVTQKSYSNGCVACSHKEVKYYIKGPCKKQ